MTMQDDEMDRSLLYMYKAHEAAATGNDKIIAASIVATCEARIAARKEG